MDRSVLSNDALARVLALRDLSDPAEGPTRDAARHRRADRSDPSNVDRRSDVVHRGPRIVEVAEKLRPSRVRARRHRARDARYSRYVDCDEDAPIAYVALIPAVLEEIARSERSAPFDRVVVCPGIVYRRDSIDRLHCGEPHQIDIWWMRRRMSGEKPLGADDLDAPHRWRCHARSGFRERRCS